MANSKRFEGKTAFITGAASGIGRATAIAFANEGARVAITDRGEAALQETAEHVKAAGAEVLAITCDVSKPEEVAGCSRTDCQNLRPHRLRIQQCRGREQGDAACRDRDRGMGPHP